uniref:Protein kinase domain-containing protein n=1 Tax=Panagrolaimus sp. PS1159 TaxID=55785 RepID=A0AC35FH49_9BILA
MIDSYNIKTNKYNRYEEQLNFHENDTKLFQQLQSIFNLKEVKAIAFSSVGHEFPTYNKFYQFWLKCREFCEKNHIFCLIPPRILLTSVALSHTKTMVQKGEKVMIFFLDMFGTPPFAVEFIRTTTSYQYIKQLTSKYPPFTQKWEKEMFDGLKPKKIILSKGPNTSDFENHQIRFCLQIADAFRYIAHKKIIHNDLKASNILVVNCKHIEISDFGKSEALINMKRIVGTITHTAIELLDKMNFPTASSSEKTDVWSFGVTVWEIFNWCHKNPYDGEIREKNKDKILNQAMIIEHLWKGKRLIPPQTMHQQLQTTIISCWSNDFFNRPSFNDLFDTFLKALPECHGLPQVKRPNSDMLPPLFAF